jgi:hypothetical protein
MKIEFAAVGDGTNVEVLLIDCLDAGWPPAEAVVDRFYTACHQFQICARPSKPEYMSCKQFFMYLEDVLVPPVIGGRYSALHIYWAERAEKRKARQ